MPRVTGSGRAELIVSEATDPTLRENLADQIVQAWSEIFLVAGQVGLLKTKSHLWNQPAKTRLPSLEEFSADHK